MLLPFTCMRGQQLLCRKTASQGMENAGSITAEHMQRVARGVLQEWELLQELPVHCKGFSAKKRAPKTGTSALICSGVMAHPTANPSVLPSGTQSCPHC